MIIIILEQMKEINNKKLNLKRLNLTKIIIINQMNKIQILSLIIHQLMVIITLIITEVEM